jgi:hypothetical protein
MMKIESGLWYMSVIVTLFVSAAAFPEILDDGYWERNSYGDGGTGGAWWTYSNAGAAANDDECSYSWGYGKGGIQLWTTEREELTASVTVYAWAEASADAGTTGDYAYAVASASGQIYGSYWTPSPDVDAYADINDPDDDEVEDDDDSQTWTFPPGEGVYADHYAAAVANCVPNEGGWSYAHSCANVSAGLE